MVGERRATTWLVTAATGLIIGAVESMLAIAFATLVFGGLLAARLPDGIGLYLGAAALILGFLAWRGGSRGVVGSVQDAPAAVLALVASVAAKKAVDLDHIARQSGLKNYERPDVFLTVIAATILVTLLCGVVFLVIGRYRLGGLIRFVPYPVVGGFLAGTGWLLFKSGINASTGSLLHLRTALAMIRAYQIVHWVPALAFGVILLVSVRVVKRPLVIPAVIAIGFVVFVAGMIATGSSIEEVRQGGWLLFGPSDTPQPWHPWTLEAITGADWLSVLALWARIGTAVFVATMAALFNINGSELVLDRDLDTNREMRDAGILNVVSGALGGIPGYHALSLTALAARMRVDARAAGLVAVLVPLAAVVFGGSVVGLIPKMIVGGVLVFLGLSFIVEWVWDKRRLLPRREYAVVLVILLGIIVWGFLWGVVIGLVLAVMLFVISYGRIELVREVAFGETYRSNVDRPADERAELRELSDRVQILRASGFVFFGSSNRLLELIRGRTEGAAPPRFLVVDLRRVTGVDSSAVVSFVKVMRLAEAVGSEVIFTGASDPVRAQLAQGGVVERDGLVSFEPDLDRGLQRCEDALLGASGRADARAHHPAGRGLDPLPPGLAAHLERVSVPEGTILLHQDEPPGDIYVLESGRLGVETVTPEGTRLRLRTLRPGVVVGEVALYAGVARTADVVAEAPSEVLRLSREAIQRLETEEPALAAALHRWLATTLAERLTDTRGALDALLD
jgi:sulfate permease, SulP family